MKKYIIGSIILLFTLLNISYFIVGASKTEPNRVFTGAVRYAPDYYMYLSYISQGESQWLTGFHLFTGETTTPTLLNWFYTLSGHLLLPLHLTPTTIYLVLTILFTITYLIAAYRLIQKLFPDKFTTQIATFLLFLTANTMPKIIQQSGVWRYLYTDSWYNFGDPTERLTYIPHHLLFEAVLLVAIVLAADWWQKYTHPRRMTIALICIGFILSGIQPALWMVMVIALGVGALWKPKNIFISMLPAVILGVSGLPFVLYLKLYVFTLPLFVNHLNEASWSLRTTPWEYLLLNGPLVITALLGLPVWAASMTRQKVALTATTAVSLLLFFSPAGHLLQILNIRFLSIIPTLFLAAVTGFWITNLIKVFPRYKILIFSGLTLLIISAIPLGAAQLRERNSLFSPANLIIYPPGDVYAAYEKATEISTPDNIFLVPPPWDTAFPGITGRRVFAYWAASHWTIDFQEKRDAAEAFFWGTMSPDEKREFLKRYNISYVFAYSPEPSPHPPLIPVYRNDLITIYKVPAL